MNSRAAKSGFLLLLAVMLVPSFSYGQDSTGVPAVGELFDTIHVVVGPSKRSLQAVAISPVECPTSVGGCATADTTVSRDLEISGYFKLLDPKSFLADPKTESLVTTSFPDWMNVGASWLIKYSVTGAGGSNVNLQFRLYDVNQKIARPVADQSFPKISESQIRASTHKFVNAVIKEITGEPGIFGSQIVLSHKTGPTARDIIVMEMDGGGRSTLVSNGSANMFPKWTRSGGVLYTSFKPGVPQLYIGKKRITNDGYQYRGGELSPDGSVIAASVDMDDQSDLVLIDPSSGKIVRKLTDTQWDEVSPSWSSDGRLIAYVSAKGGDPQIYLMNSDGSGERRLTMAGAYNTGARFGPGNKVVFAGMDEFRSDLFVADLDGNISRLTQDQGNNKDAAWSPDGRYFVFLSDRTGGWKVWIMTEDGRYQFPISADEGWFGTPDWK
jgi:TolB protein